MVRTQTRSFILGIQSGGADSIYLSSFGAKEIVLTMQRVDLNVGGTQSVFAYNNSLYFYNLANDIFHMSGIGSTSAYYEFRKSDIGQTTAHEFINGASFTTAVNAVISSTAGNQRYWGSYGVSNGSGAGAIQDTASGVAPLRGAENVGQGWSLVAWLFFASGAASSEFYLDSNATSTNFMQFIRNNVTGQLSLSRVGSNGTSPGILAGIMPTATWIHLALVYTPGAPGSIVTYFNGVLQGSVASGTPGTNWTGTGLQRINGTGNVYETQIGAYRGISLSADQVLNQYNLLAFDEHDGFFQVSPALSQGGAVTVIFSNEVTPGAIAGSLSNTSLALPLTPNMRVAIGGGVWQGQYTTYYET